MSTAEKASIPAPRMRTEIVEGADLMLDPGDVNFNNISRKDRQKEVSDGHPENAISAYGTARSTVQGAPLSSQELREIDEYWRASLYLCLGMLYLQDNPLLREPLKIEHVKPRMLGHWGSDAGQTFTYIHFNRLIKKYDLNAIYLSGPGHGAPAVLSQGYLEGTYSEIYPDKSSGPSRTAAFLPAVFHSRAASAATPRPRHPAASTRAASWVTASRTPMGRSTTTRT